MPGRGKSELGQGLSQQYALLSSPKGKFWSEIGTVSLVLNQISSTGAEIEGKQAPSPPPVPLAPGRPLTLSSCRNVLWFPTLLWPQLSDSPWG